MKAASEQVTLWTIEAQSHWGPLKAGTGQSLQNVPPRGEGAGVFIHQLPEVIG